jgi:hypothetical protein
MAERSLKELITSYINGQIYWFRFEKQIDAGAAEKYANALGTLESLMRQHGINNEQIDQLLYYGKYFYELKAEKISETQINYVTQKVLGKKV